MASACALSLFSCPICIARGLLAVQIGYPDEEDLGESKPAVGLAETQKWRLFQDFYPFPLSPRNLGLEFVRLILLVFLRPRGVTPDDASPLNLLLVSSHESF